MLDYYSLTGWFARDPAILSRVGRTLLQHPDNGLARPSKIIIAEDCFKLLSIPSGRITNVLLEAVKQIYGGKIIFYSPYLNLSMHHFKIIVNSDKISIHLLFRFVLYLNICFQHANILHGSIAADDILNYANLGDAVERDVPSLKNFMRKDLKNHEYNIEPLVALSNAMRLLQRCR